MLEAQPAPHPTRPQPAPDGAREVYGLPSAASPEFPELVAAISVDDAQRLRELLTANPDLVRQRLTLHSSLPLTLAARECSLGAFRVLLAAGAEVGADYHAALFRACTSDCPEAASLLIEQGADVNAHIPEYGPVLMAACECHSLECVRLLLLHGADPNRKSDGRPARAVPSLGTPLGMAIGTRARSAHRQAIVNALIDAGAEFDDGPVMDLHRGDLKRLADRLHRDPEIVRVRFPLPYGVTPLDGGTLLHVAADFGDLEAARLLLDAGAEVDARAGGLPEGTTPLFHAAAAPAPRAQELIDLLRSRGADVQAQALIEVDGEPRRFTPATWGRASGSGHA